ncbi:MAG: RluA family pseudouridine synthase [Candidatus Omnitrophica bacterium]|nr:RluA family pseudouridine synthase [Candidatus Omnitrophota bacterium]
MKTYNFEVEQQDAGKRLDILLLDYANQNDLGLSRTFLQVMLKEGKVALNSQLCSKAHHKVCLGDKIRIDLAEKIQETLLAEKIPIVVVYEDKDVAVINKPVGLVVHPAPGNREHTLANALLHRFKKLSDVNPGRPGIVHRLDKETSGIMVIAKNNKAHLHLAKQFSDHTIKRKYIALVEGRVEFDQNIIEVPIERHPLNRKSMAVGYGPASKYAKTLYRTIKRTDRYSLLELEPFTGRTHQLRVHLAFLGHPILGDEKYGKKILFKRLGLHALYLGFIHPATEKFVEFSSKMPVEFSEFINKNKT